MSHVTLLGAEDVLRASRNITDAADTMRTAGNNMMDAVFQLERLQESFLTRLEQLVERMEALKP